MYFSQATVIAFIAATASVNANAGIYERNADLLARNAMPEDDYNQLAARHASPEPAPLFDAMKNWWKARKTSGKSRLPPADASMSAVDSSADPDAATGGDADAPKGLRKRARPVKTINRHSRPAQGLSDDESEEADSFGPQLPPTFGAGAGMRRRHALEARDYYDGLAAREAELEERELYDELETRDIQDGLHSRGLYARAPKHKQSLADPSSSMGGAGGPMDPSSGFGGSSSVDDGSASFGSGPGSLGSASGSLGSASGSFGSPPGGLSRRELEELEAREYDSYLNARDAELEAREYDNDFYRRDYDDLDARDYDDLEARDYDDLYARDYDDLYARDYDDLEARDYDDLEARDYDDLEARDYDDLEARDYDAELYGRDYEDLYARDDEDLYARDDEDLYARDDEDLYARDDEDLYARDDEDLYARDDEDLYARDDEDLYARNTDVYPRGVWDTGKSRRSLDRRSPTWSVDPRNWGKTREEVNARMAAKRARQARVAAARLDPAGGSAGGSGGGSAGGFGGGSAGGFGGNSAGGFGDSTSGAQGSDSGMQRRDVYERDLDEQDLYARELYDDLDARDTDDELFGRDVYDDDLYARDYDADLYTRDYDELEARDFEDPDLYY